MAKVTTKEEQAILKSQTESLLNGPKSTHNCRPKAVVGLQKFRDFTTIPCKDSSFELG